MPPITSRSLGVTLISDDPRKNRNAVTAFIAAVATDIWNDDLWFVAYVVYGALVPAVFSLPQNMVLWSIVVYTWRSFGWGVNEKRAMVVLRVGVYVIAHRRHFF